MSDTQTDLVPLKEHIEVLVANLEKRLVETQRANELALSKANESAERAIQKAIEASDRALTKATEATDKAIIKAEEANNKRLDGLNEFRASLADQTAKYVSQAELAALREAHAAKIEALQKNVNFGLGVLAAVQVLIAVFLSVAKLFV